MLLLELIKLVGVFKNYFFTVRVTAKLKLEDVLAKKVLQVLPLLLLQTTLGMQTTNFVSTNWVLINSVNSVETLSFTFAIFSN